MKKYNSQLFIEAFLAKTKGKNVPDCPYCGCKEFTSTDNFASILINDNKKINLWMKKS